jgi:hypothetical protein
MERKKKSNDRLTKKHHSLGRSRTPYFSHSVFLDAWELRLLSRNLEMQNGLKMAPLIYILYGGTKKDCQKGKILWQFDLKTRWLSWS